MKRRYVLVFLLKLVNNLFGLHTLSTFFCLVFYDDLSNFTHSLQQNRSNHSEAAKKPNQIKSSIINSEMCILYDLIWLFCGF